MDEFVPDFVAEAERQMAAEAQNQTERKEVTIKFGKGLVEEPFMSKSGREMVEIKIPNQEQGDSRPWESFVLPKNYVHDNKFGKGVWVKLPEDGSTRLSRSVAAGEQDGKTVWKRETREVPNVELKSMMEFYKTRDSVLETLKDGKNAPAGPKEGKVLISRFCAPVFVKLNSPVFCMA